MSVLAGFLRKSFSMATVDLLHCFDQLVEGACGLVGFGQAVLDVGGQVGAVSDVLVLVGPPFGLSMMLHSLVPLARTCATDCSSGLGHSVNGSSALSEFEYLPSHHCRLA